MLILLLAGCSGVPTGTAPATPSAPSAAATASAPASPTPSPSATHDHDDDHGAGDAGAAFAATRAELLATQASAGTPAALALLDERIATDPTVAGVCHAIAHELGHVAVEQSGGDARQALALGTEVCGGGFTHGVIEVVLGASRRPGRDLLRICAPANDGSCFHGVGHGLMFATGMDVDRSLELCDRSPSSSLSARCGEGVFMQLFSSDLSAQHVAGSAAFDVASDPAGARATCRGTRDRYAPNCWFYAPTVWLTVHPDDFTGAMDWCRGAGTDVGRQLCARGVGSRTVKYHPDDLAVGEQVCAAAGGLTDSCLQGMGSYWSVHHGGRLAAASVCRRLDDRALRDRCRQVV